MRYLYGFCLLLLVISCRRDTGDMALNRVWQDDNPFERLASSWEPIIYKGMAVYGWNSYANDLLYNMPIEARDLNTGAVKWTWNEYFTDVETGGGISAGYFRHIYGNVLVFSLNTALYAIDLETGQTLWKKRVLMSSVYLRSLGPTFFNSVFDLERTAYHIVKGDTWTGDMDTIFTYIKSTDYPPHLSTPYPYINQVGDTMLVFTNVVYHPTSPIKELYFYNMSADSLAMMYDSSVVFANNGLYILADAGKIFLGGGTVNCFDGNTYQKLWDRENPKGIGFIGFLVRDGVLYYGTEGLDQDLFAVDAATGNEIWRAESGGFCGPMSYYNDVIYYNSGGDGKMHCVKASTGEVLGLFDAPGFKKNSDDFFTHGLSIDPTTGRIYTASFLSALCFEPLQ